LMQLSFELFRVVDHRAELVQRESAAAQAAARLLEDYGSGRSDSNCGRNRQHQRRQDDERDGGKRHIEGTLEEEQKLALRCARQAQQLEVAKLLEIDPRVRCGQELQLYAHLHAEIGTVQHHRLQSRKLLHGDGEDDLVDHLVLKYV